MPRKKELRPFEMKQFKISHSRSAIRIGVDAVLVGAWGYIDKGCVKILDAGCGCGIISLMAAQRNCNALITAVDIHKESVEEASLNFLLSKWSDRLHAECDDISHHCLQHSQYYDIILSNPPFFDAGIESPDSPRLTARHCTSFSPGSLLKFASYSLKEGGILSMIFPASSLDELKNAGKENGMILKRVCHVRDSVNTECKRVLAMFSHSAKEVEGVTEEDTLILHTRTDDGDRVATDSYRNLCKDFYLKM